MYITWPVCLRLCQQKTWFGSWFCVDLSEKRRFSWTQKVPVFGGTAVDPQVTVQKQQPHYVLGSFCEEFSNKHIKTFCDHITVLSKERISIDIASQFAQFGENYKQTTTILKS